MGRGVALLFHDRSTGRGWEVSSTPRPHFTPGKEPASILQEAGWIPGPVWTGGKSRPHRDSIPDRPALSSVLYRLNYRAHSKWLHISIKYKHLVTLIYMRQCCTALFFITVSEYIIFTYFTFLFYCNKKFSRSSCFIKWFTWRCPMGSKHVREVR